MAENKPKIFFYGTVAERRAIKVIAAQRDTDYTALMRKAYGLYMFLLETLPEDEFDAYVERLKAYAGELVGQKIERQPSTEQSKDQEMLDLLSRFKENKPDEFENVLKRMKYISAQARRAAKSKKKHA